eukprot:GHVT01073826.1.p1 GENE.GHVT01073826.1~~GHVT01073826.1.p1  ORF type:complete len:283 (+),score=35.98 GHVT01073826.1:2032-2880(+)
MHTMSNSAFSSGPAARSGPLPSSSSSSSSSSSCDLSSCGSSSCRSSCASMCACLGRVYLICFSIVSTLLWGHVAYLTITHLIAHGLAAPEVFWSLVARPVRIAQTTALLEILHSLLGLVRSPLVLTSVQVLSRLQLVWGIWELVPASHDSTMAALTCILSWAIAELLRYPYYAFKVAVDSEAKVPVALKWIRYSGFLPLYPTGILSECVCIYTALPFMANDFNLLHFPYPMPNRLNFQMDLFRTYQVVLYAVYPLGAYILYKHMLKQRKKQIYGEVVKDKGV